MADPSESRPETRKGLPWWGMGLIAVLGAAAPQLCSFIPNAAGAVVCQVLARAAVAVATQQQSTPLPPTPPAHQDCPDGRRLSTGQCLPEASPPKGEAHPL